ncbi:hypothetical protein CPB83DRAFT_844074 [Crepidotus variabilis]|uniref:Uncharacterized protein n=1 Tax=Crepidotus variabilis TaxID=179855 RepID=A0A9P6ET22_9AGAR|nr:hypothetical protein CPB83DRAFT_844074 [Crepidotus variabilis]
MAWIILCWTLFSFLFHVQAQNLSTTTPVPPLQWINLTNLLQGSTKPPPLKDAAIGYDEVSRTLIIFGGVSESGVPQSQTFLLNLQSLSWSVPSPPSNLQRSPPSRSSVVSGHDFAASNRHGFVVIGGKGSDNTALSDVWEYDFTNQFWSQVQLSAGGPSPRWGASGGIDIRVAPIQDQLVPGPNNTIYLAGGFDGKAVDSLSEVWRLNISGTLSSNLPSSVMASWDRLDIGNLPGRIEHSGTVISQQIVSAGGCPSLPEGSDVNCATQDSFILDTQRRSTLSPGACTAPRVGPVVVPNLNAFSSAFTSQAFVLLGTFNSTTWKDSDGLTRGEVAVLDTNTATWTRILPAGDPGSTGRAQFPTPRQGAAALSYSQALVGDVRARSSDTIIFGGQDAKGNFLSDMWLLRAYSGMITPSSTTWSGFGSGNLQSGINADGSGVRVSYLNECAIRIAEPISNPSSTSSSAPTNTPPPKDPTPVLFSTAYDASFLHKLLAPLSLVVLFPVILSLRWAVFSDGYRGTESGVFIQVSFLGAIVAFGLGVAGLILGFTTISSSQVSSSHLHFKTGHSIAGLVFFLCLYIIIPIIYLALLRIRIRSRRELAEDVEEKDGDIQGSVGKPESEDIRSLTSSLRNASPPPTRTRTMSWDTTTAIKMAAATEGSGPSNESSVAPTPSGFEVLNRQHRARKTSGQSPPPLTVRPLPSTLSDIDWLLRRRSLNAVGELDYMLTQVHNAQVAASAAQGDQDPIANVNTATKYPTIASMALHLFTHMSIIGIAAVTLAALWTTAPRYYFAIFMVWVVTFYLLMLACSWGGRPAPSLLTATVWRIRSSPPPPLPIQSSTPDALKSPPPTVAGPYARNRPTHRTATQAEEQSYLQAMSAEDEGDDELDEDTRQRLIEQEMDRRDVSIVTVPRRKLQIANPS